MVNRVLYVIFLLKTSLSVCLDLERSPRLWLGVIYGTWLQYCSLNYSTAIKIKHFASTVLMDNNHFMKNGNYFCWHSKHSGQCDDLVEAQCHLWHGGPSPDSLTQPGCGTASGEHLPRIPLGISHLLCTVKLRIRQLMAKELTSSARQAFKIQRRKE